MMDWTTSDCRYFHRQLSRHALLYTEMVTTGALLHGDVQKHLQHHQTEHPVALQLGGSDPSDLARCTALAQEWGYDEVNLNVGCPSDRVQNGSFGACLMKEPALVRDCLSAMRAAGDIPVTIKHRIGVDDDEGYGPLRAFVEQVAQSGVSSFTVHARKAILQGLSPKQNREVPPLHYDYVYQLKQDFPELEVVINGGIKTHADCETHLQHVDGVMLGREAYHNPYMLAEVDQRYFGSENPPIGRVEAAEAMFSLVEDYCDSNGGKLMHITRHMMGLFLGQPGAKQYKRYLSENAWREGAGRKVLEEALSFIA